MGGLVDKGRVTEQHLGIRIRGGRDGGQEEQATHKDGLKRKYRAEAIMTTKCFLKIKIISFSFSFGDY